jgi:hypothetical protein
LALANSGYSFCILLQNSPSSLATFAIETLARFGLDFAFQVGHNILQVTAGTTFYRIGKFCYHD